MKVTDLFGEEKIKEVEEAVKDKVEDVVKDKVGDVIEDLKDGDLSGLKDLASKFTKSDEK